MLYLTGQLEGGPRDNDNTQMVKLLVITQSHQKAYDSISMGIRNATANVTNIQPPIL